MDRQRLPVYGPLIRSLAAFVLAVGVVVPVSLITAPAADAKPRLLSGGLMNFGCASTTAKVHCLGKAIKSPRGSGPLLVSTPVGLTPTDIQSAYKLPSSTQGAGQTIAIVDAFDDPTAETDLGAYRSQFGLSACTTQNGCSRTFRVSSPSLSLSRKHRQDRGAQAIA